MAKVIGGIGTSHVPTIGMAFDKGKQGDPTTTATIFFFDHYPTFCPGRQ